jgi:hypothetical protein
VKSDPVSEYDVGQPIRLSCLFLRGQTVGSMEAGQSTVFVRDLSRLTLSVDSEIVVEGAGYVGGDLRTSVVSDDGVGAIVVGDAARASVQLGLVGTPADPDEVVCTVAPPGGEREPVETASTVAGLWEGTFVPSVEGEHFYRFAGTGLASGSRWRKFMVRADRG